MRASRINSQIEAARSSVRPVDLASSVLRSNIVILAKERIKYIITAARGMLLLATKKRTEEKISSRSVTACSPVLSNDFGRGTRRVQKKLGSTSDRAPRFR
jgi:hypothetical protein